MAAKGHARSDKFERWDVLLTNKEQLAEIPQVAPDLLELERMSGDARILVGRGDDLRSQLLKNTGELKDLLAEGEKVRSRIGLYVQARFGFTSEQLVKFGFKQRRVPRRKKTDDPAVIGAHKPGKAEAP